VAAGSTVSAAGSGATTATLGLVAKWVGIGALAAASGTIGSGASLRPRLDPPTASAPKPAAGRPASSPLLPPRRLATAGKVIAPAEPDTDATGSLERAQPRSIVPGADGRTKAPRYMLPDAPRQDEPHRTRAADRNESPLTSETLLVDAARAALQAGNARRVLELLSGYESRHPAHQLGPEVCVLRMEAHMQQGNEAAARQLARRVLKSTAAAPQLQRAREVLGRRHDETAHNH
jgi:hypothetical protein